MWHSRGDGQTQKAYEGILKLIGSDYVQGDRLSTRELADKVGVSITPIREALRQLAEQGFVEHVPGGGSYVAEMDLRSAIEMIEIRGALEELAARRFVTRATEVDFEVLTRLAEETREAIIARDEPRLHEGDILFHRYIVDRCENHSLQRRAEFQRLISDIFRSAIVRDIDEDTWQTIDPNAHLKLLVGLKTGDPDLAADAVRKHIQLSVTRIKRRWTHVLESPSAGGESPYPDTLGKGR